MNLGRWLSRKKFSWGLVCSPAPPASWTTFIHPEGARYFQKQCQVSTALDLLSHRNWLIIWYSQYLYWRKRAFIVRIFIEGSKITSLRYSPMSRVMLLIFQPNPFSCWSWGSLVAVGTTSWTMPIDVCFGWMLSTSAICYFRSRSISHPLMSVSVFLEHRNILDDSQMNVRSTNAVALLVCLPVSVPPLSLR